MRLAHNARCPRGVHGYADRTLCPRSMSTFSTVDEMARKSLKRYLSTLLSTVSIFVPASPLTPTVHDRGGVRGTVDVDTWTSETRPAHAKGDF